jgi:hypothetical protein
VNGNDDGSGGGGGGGGGGVEAVALTCMTAEVLCCCYGGLDECELAAGGGAEVDKWYVLVWEREDGEEGVEGLISKSALPPLAGCGEQVMTDCVRLRPCAFPSPITNQATKLPAVSSAAPQGALLFAIIYTQTLITGPQCSMLCLLLSLTERRCAHIAPLLPPAQPG